MRDDDRRHRQDEEELFSDLRTEMENLERADPSTFADSDAVPAGEPGFGPKGNVGPPPLPSEAPGPARSALAAYPPEGFDSDEALGKLPTLSPGAGRRRAASSHRTRKGPPRLLLGALCVILAGAAFLFWPRGQQEPPLGIGEQSSVVTADDARQGRISSPPITDEVDIDAQRQPLVPERTGGDAATPAISPSPSPTPADAGAETPIVRQVEADVATPTPPVTPPASESEDTLQPGPEGTWALQLGAFSSQENADALLAKLQAKGLQPRLQTGSASSGRLVYKVSIGYFQTRDDAAAYARRHARLLGGQALPVHR